MIHIEMRMSDYLTKVKDRTVSLKRDFSNEPD
jgi:hypothetical protein